MTKTVNNESNEASHQLTTSEQYSIIETTIRVNIYLMQNTSKYSCRPFVYNIRTKL